MLLCKHDDWLGLPRDQLLIDFVRRVVCCFGNEQLFRNQFIIYFMLEVVVYVLSLRLHLRRRKRGCILAVREGSNAWEVIK